MGINRKKFNTAIVNVILTKKYNLTNLLYIWCKLSIIINKFCERTVSYNGAIWDDFNEQH